MKTALQRIAVSCSQDSVGSYRKAHSIPLLCSGCYLCVHCAAQCSSLNYYFIFWLYLTLSPFPQYIQPEISLN